MYTTLGFGRALFPEMYTKFRSFGLQSLPLCMCIHLSIQTHSIRIYHPPNCSWGGDLNPCMQTYLLMLADARQCVDGRIEECGIAVD